ncbi:16S rRNA (guanine(527)-N(7))-methyltransferase RsmG [Helcobacillus massiliensis]|uniref:Ribosomal RNA small subunit methyltransferase G n=1 Tax=Helcobacillus massiliensis TaxID=521392 RepID=A0A839R1V7_9MICO|nr:16S rRNA (guanine(527)-N(7))-methyltransferase RsmG [Helcobacillus massiliensis]MBB3024067.1 16S rRNA (guanine527-N7)-methyltransferase [Helcobacillus massiliensis]MCT1558042.1 16S rRNA (guanine(527)-N(7))-methyltransferase RsmG [Helcobacillus massiliensis]MCT2036708.1 16S rRNA (guanine(527)-N(7))-methyltransferase RsmG [Helcobacillus massiliensis]MCT2330766.1 16S rRNA (guanine(527)-N(7))-methyltransferase RsmG [Helcobacillus massiliensis]
MTERLAPPAEHRALAEELFGRNLPLAERYARLLQTKGAEQGLIGPREVDRIWERHVLNCALMVRALETPQGADGAAASDGSAASSGSGTSAESADSAAALPEPVRTLADVGSGAGLPGLVLAIARPDIDITLIETMQRRCIWLEETLEDLAALDEEDFVGTQLPQVTVVRARAEELHGEQEFDVVTARAVAALDKLAKWTLPLVRVGGRLVALKGQSAPQEIEKAQKTLQRLGGENARIELIRAEGIEVPTTVVSVDVTARPQKKGSRGGK